MYVQCNKLMPATTFDAMHICLLEKIGFQVRGMGIWG